MTRYKDDKVNPLDRGSLAAADAAMYGATPVDVDTGRVVAKGIPLEKIRADVRQPRRAIPASVRLYWDGSQGTVSDLLGAWMEIAVDAGGDIDVVAMMRGKGDDGVETEGKPAIFEQFVDLVRLAADIDRVGLTNPISVVEQAGSYVIESGERRWLAYNMLQVALGDDKYKRIPAFVVDGSNFVWRQASENTARRSLNAIGMARQLALLIMESRRGVDGQTYDEWDDIVVPGGCDRPFYAQVANGNIHRVPKGMGERIQQAMGLSKKRIFDYRNLLRLTDNNEVNDVLWTRADVEDWPEGIMREIADRLPIGNLSDIVSREDWTLQDLRDAIDEVNRGRVIEALDRQTGGREIADRLTIVNLSGQEPAPSAPPRQRVEPPPATDEEDQREVVHLRDLVPRVVHTLEPDGPANVNYDADPPEGFYNGALVRVIKHGLAYGWDRNKLTLTGDAIFEDEQVTFLEMFEYEGQAYALVWPHERGDRDARFILRMKVLQPVASPSANPYKVGDVVKVKSDGTRCVVREVRGDVLVVDSAQYGSYYGQFYHTDLKAVEEPEPSDKADSVGADERASAPDMPPLVNDLLRFVIQSGRMEVTATQLKHEAWKYSDQDYADTLDELREFDQAVNDLFDDALRNLRSYLDAVSSLSRLPGDEA